jgi:hypothetical protein
MLQISGGIYIAIMKFKPDNEISNKNEGPKIYDLSFRELAEREELMVHQKDEFQIVRARAIPFYYNRFITVIEKQSKSWDIKNDLSKKKITSYAAKLGCSILARDARVNTLLDTYNELSEHGADKESVALAYIDSKPMTLVTRMGNIGGNACGANYPLFDKTKDWVSSNCTALGMTQGDLALFCITIGFGRIGEIVNPLHKEQLETAIDVFEKYLVHRAKLLSIN